MAIPTHNIGCITKVYKTNCPDCGQEAFFFSCSCGSKVFFDEVGYPWPMHHCAEYSLRKQIEIIHNVDRLSTQEIFKIITKHEKSTGSQIDDATLEVIESIVGTRKYEFKCTDVPPGEETEVGGTVMEINNPINIYKKLGYEQNPMSEILLGKLAKEEWVQLIIRTKPNKKNESLQYHVFLKRSEWLKKKITKGDTIVGIVSPLSMRKAFFGN